MRWARIALLSAVISAGGCSAATRARVESTTARPACDSDQQWTGTACSARRAGSQIEQAAAALSEFRVDDALGLLEKARKSGPHSHAEHILLYEQLGIAYAYLERESDALAAFDMLLTLDPGHLLSYTLSPKATFLFERVRAEARNRARPAVDVSWARNLEVTKPVEVELETVADPKEFLRTASLHMRKKGDAKYRVVDVELPGPGQYRRVSLPPLASSKDEVLELYLTAYDSMGNEVLHWASRERPRDVPLRYQAPTPWYRKWWIWAVAGGCAAAATGISVAIITDKPADEINADVVIR